MWSTAFALDAVTVVVVLISAVTAYRRGFLNSIVRLVGTLGSALLCMHYSDPAAEWIYGRFFEKRVLTAISENIDRFGQPGLEAFSKGLEGLMQHLPMGIRQALGLRLPQDLKLWYDKVWGSASDFPLALADSVISPLAVSLLQAIIFCVLFALCSFAVGALARLLKGVNRVPLIGGVNAVLGGLLGIVQGLLYVFVLASLLWLLIAATGDTLTPITSGAIGQTVLFRHFLEIAPWTSA
ncbi:MAG: CvpA family protein [Oscillospiraceae bacterium]